jgi:hypothetical protein
MNSWQVKNQFFIFSLASLLSFATLRVSEETRPHQGEKYMNLFGNSPFWRLRAWRTA